MTVYEQVKTVCGCLWPVHVLVLAYFDLVIACYAWLWLKYAVLWSAIVCSGDVVCLVISGYALAMPC